MSMLRKIYGILKGMHYCRYAEPKVVIRDYGTTYSLLSKSCITGCGRLTFNANAVDHREYSKIRMGGGKLCIMGDVSLFTRANIHVFENAILSIGDGTYINEGANVAVKHRISIGEHCAISNDVSIMDSDFHTIIDKEEKESGVSIGNHVWIGEGAIILKNVSIGDNCIIGAKTVVTKNVPSGCVAVGNPIKIIKTDVNWK